MSDTPADVGAMEKIVRLSVTENESGIYLDSNAGWVVEVVHWPRSPAALKRDDARAFAHKLVGLWNTNDVLMRSLRRQIESCGICGGAWDAHEDDARYCPYSPADRAINGDTRYCAKSTWEAYGQIDTLRQQIAELYYAVMDAENILVPPCGEIGTQEAHAVLLCAKLAYEATIARAKENA